eukprot:526625-Rhodomonas_salina.2
MEVCLSSCPSLRACTRTALAAPTCPVCKTSVDSVRGRSTTPSPQKQHCTQNTPSQATVLHLVVDESGSSITCVSPGHCLSHATATSRHNEIQHGQPRSLRNVSRKQCFGFRYMRARYSARVRVQVGSGTRKLPDVRAPRELEEPLPEHAHPLAEVPLRQLTVPVSHSHAVSNMPRQLALLTVEYWCSIGEEGRKCSRDGVASLEGFARNTCAV